MDEIWKPVNGFEGYYEVSNLGRVRRLDRYDYGCGYPRLYKGGILKLLCGSSGYYHIMLCKDGKRITKNIHRIVADAFIPNPDNLPQVNHKDEDKSNNRVDNLEWCSPRYNCSYGTKNRRCNNTKIERNLVDPETVGQTPEESKELYNEKHKEEIRQKEHNRYLTNKDKIKERSKKYYYEHREKILSRIRKYK